MNENKEIYDLLDEIYIDDLNKPHHLEVFLYKVREILESKMTFNIEKNKEKYKQIHFSIDTDHKSYCIFKKWGLRTETNWERDARIKKEQEDKLRSEAWAAQEEKKDRELYLKLKEKYEKTS